MKLKGKLEGLPFKCGTVAIVGRPNVGKSTLLNLLVQFKLSAVSPKPQTTWHKILGILTEDHFQVVFLDTPGMPYEKRDQFNRRLLIGALDGIEESDLVILMVEPKDLGKTELRLVEELKQGNKPAIVAINKVDLVKKLELLPIIDEYSRLYPFLEIMPISAIKPDGVDELLRLIVKHLPEGEPLFSPDEVTDRTERFLVTEAIREKVFNAYGQEVPYSVAVEIETFEEGSNRHGGKDYIKAILYVEKESQKAILIGMGGEMLKKIGTQARQEIEKLLERPAYLELWVKVYPKWRKDKAFLQRI